eukprot:Rhum_TRINITY_DN23031_c0_g1::Rhum_TRINITY_DN23031_c0_g1_i1::g.176954::m.176954
MYSMSFFFCFFFFFFVCFRDFWPCPLCDPSLVVLLDLVKLLENRGLCGSSRRAPPLHRRLERPHILDVRVERGAQRLQLVEGHLSDGAALCLGHAHQLADDVVRVAEGQSLADQVVGHVRRKHVDGQRRLQLVLVDRHRLDHAREHLQAQLHGVRRVEHALLVLLHVLVVRRRQPLHHHEDRHQRPDHAPRLAPQELHRVRVLLLRHQRRARRVAVRERDELELRGAVDAQVLGDPRQVHQQQRRREEELCREVAVRRRVERVRRGAVLEPQALRQRLPVEPERVAGERGRAQRALAEAVPRAAHGGEPVQVAHPAPRVREQPVREAHGLRPLQVRVAREDQVNLLLCADGRRLDQRLQQPRHFVQLVAHPQPEVDGHLVVARAPGVQLARHLLADDLTEAPLVRRVDVLVAVLHLEAAVAPPLPHLLQAVLHLRALVLRDQLQVHKLLAVRDAAVEVLRVQALVVGDRVVELLHHGVHTLREPPACLKQAAPLASVVGCRHRGCSACVCVCVSMKYRYCSF